MNPKRLSIIAKEQVVHGDASIAVVDFLWCLAFFDVFQIAQHPPEDLPAPKFTEPVTSDQPLKALLVLKESRHKLDGLLRLIGGDFQDRGIARLDTFRAWLGHRGVHYMRHRCDLVKKKVDTLKTAAGSAVLTELMARLDTATWTGMSAEDSKALLQPVTKSAEIKSLVSEFNEWDVTMGWPSQVKSFIVGFHPGVSAKVDLLEATVREAAANLQDTCRFVIAHATCVQALCSKYGTGPKSAMKATNCKLALDRAKEWNVTLKAGVQTALQEALRSA